MQVDAHNTERALRKIKRHPSLVAVDVNGPDTVMKDKDKEVGEASRYMDRSADKPEESCSQHCNGTGSEAQSFQKGETPRKGENVKASVGAPSSW